MRGDEGPTKNLFLKRQRNAQQDTKALWSLLVFLIQEQKGYIKTWSVYIAFC